MQHSPTRSRFVKWAVTLREIARLENGVIYLMVIYAKVVRGAIPAHALKAIKETIHHGER